jgi:hypothetical protein
MTKDAFYFPHDSNASSDRKMIRLRRVCGLAGYGFYWIIIEKLRDAPQYQLPVASISDYVFEFRAEEKFFDEFFACELLERDEVHFWSSSLCRRMTALDNKREQARNAGIASAQKRNGGRSTDVQPNTNDRSTGVQPKRGEKMKVEESKKDDDANPKISNIADALGKLPIHVTPTEEASWQELTAIGVTLDDLKSARESLAQKKKPINSLNNKMLQTEACQMRDKRKRETEDSMKGYFG